VSANTKATVSSAEGLPTKAVQAAPIACPSCPATCTDYVLGYVCAACGWRQDRCEDCGALMTWDPHTRGTTCGGLALVGARVCVPCGRWEVCRLSRPADAVDWTLSKGGRSLTAGGIKLRAEASPNQDIEGLMARIVQVPALELEIAELRALRGKDVRGR
jgi:hypothetical protein